MKCTQPFTGALITPVLKVPVPVEVRSDQQVISCFMPRANTSINDVVFMRTALCCGHHPSRLWSPPGSMALPGIPIKFSCLGETVKKAHYLESENPRAVVVVVCSWPPYGVGRCRRPYRASRGDGQEKRIIWQEVVFCEIEGLFLPRNRESENLVR